MAGLGKYTISPEFSGGFSVKHDSKKLSKHYDSTVQFQYELQKHDWALMFKAANAALDMAMKIKQGRYFTRNEGVQLSIITHCTNAIIALSKAKPTDQAVNLKYMIEHLPLFARTPQPQYNQVITDNIKVLSDYYKRYLLKYETFNNSFLTA